MVENARNRMKSGLSMKLMYSTLTSGAVVQTGTLSDRESPCIAPYFLWIRRVEVQPVLGVTTILKYLGRIVKY